MLPSSELESAAVMMTFTGDFKIFVDAVAAVVVFNALRVVAIVSVPVGATDKPNCLLLLVI